MLRHCASLLLLLVLPAAVAADDTYRVLHTWPHDPAAYTQGLIYEDGHLYESTGLNGHSSLREVDLQTGRVLREHDLPDEYFGEGLTNWKNTLLQITWKAHTGFVYDRSTFRLLRTFHYSGEGWGLTQDGHSLILSDGTSNLRFLDPDTFEQVRSLAVTDQGKPLTQINELEYIHGLIYANIWFSNRIARISPQTGRVVGWINLTGIIPLVELRSNDSVLNGIAYDSENNRLLVTGKLWPKLFEIRIVPGNAN
jgi:glutaminyl-peptide cyclotransferase